MSQSQPSTDPRLRAMLKLAPVIPVFVPDDVASAVQTARALLRGGLPVIEVTLRTPQALDAIAAIAEQVPDMVVGAGTVLTPDQLKAVQQAGARFAVSPGATDALYWAARETGLPLLPGVATASEIQRGLEHGLDTFKFFPAVPAGGTAMLAAFAGPFADVRFCPTGGITPATARDFLRQSNVLCVGGSWLTPRDAIAAGNWSLIEQLAAEAAALAG